MKIHIYNQQKALLFSKSALNQAIRALIAYLNLKTREISLYLIDSTKSSELHAQFFADPTPTDCMSFPIDSDFLGEIFICPEVAITYAKKRKIDPYEETLLYLIHAILHLAGYDDLDTKKKRSMRKKEKSCMRHLKTQGISLTP